MDLGEAIINKLPCLAHYTENKNRQRIGFPDNTNLYSISNAATVVDKKVETATWFEPLGDSYIGANKEIMGWACGRRMNSENDNSAA